MTENIAGYEYSYIKSSQTNYTWLALLSTTFFFKPPYILSITLCIFHPHVLFILPKKL